MKTDLPSLTADAYAGSSQTVRAASDAKSKYAQPALKLFADEIARLNRTVRGHEISPWASDRIETVVETLTRVVQGRVDEKVAWFDKNIEGLERDPRQKFTSNIQWQRARRDILKAFGAGDILALGQLRAKHPIAAEPITQLQQLMAKAAAL